MLCPSCNGFRPANNAPCPLCNAPSPLVNEARNGQNAPFASNQGQATFAPSWGGPDANQNNWSGSSSGQMSFPSAPQPNFGGSGIQQMAFPSAPQPNFGGSGAQPFAQPSDGSDNTFWSQNMATRGAEKQQSLLPVPYQGQPGVNEQALSLLPMSFPTISPGIQQVNSLVPALPDSDQEAPVYVPPMYTKPRPIIPRYRAISGLISVIIVFALLCGGASYYAQVTGKLTGLEKLFGFYTPPSVTAAQKTLPVPSNQLVQGPAANVVYSVGISNKVDNTTGMVPVEVNQFTADEVIYLTCSARPPKDGVLTVKWYSNGSLYQNIDTPIFKAKGVQQTAILHISYGLPSEGKVEVYWNHQLAATVLFVVEPAG